MDRTKLCYYPKSMKTKHWQLINIIFNFHSLTKNICVTWINKLTKSIENPKGQNSNVLCNPNYGFQSLDFTKNITVLYVFLILSFDKNVGIGQVRCNISLDSDLTKNSSRLQECRNYWKIQFHVKSALFSVIS